MRLVHYFKSSFYPASIQCVLVSVRLWNFFNGGSKLVRVLAKMKLLCFVNGHNFRLTTMILENKAIRKLKFSKNVAT